MVPRLAHLNLPPYDSQDPNLPFGRILWRSHTAVKADLYVAPVTPRTPSQPRYCIVKPGGGRGLRLPTGGRPRPLIADRTSPADAGLVGDPEARRNRLAHPTLDLLAQSVNEQRVARGDGNVLL